MYHIICLLTENTAMHVAHVASLRTSFCTIIIVKQESRAEEELLPRDQVAKNGASF